MSARVSVLLLASLLASACGKPPVQVQIPFIAEFKGLPVGCEAGGEMQLTDLRFYVHDVYLMDSAGKPKQLELVSDNHWQQANLALLDLEDGKGGCTNGTLEINKMLLGNVAAGNYHGLRFTLGVPFEQNHSDPLLAAAPLDDAAMHWHWRGGYKFLRAGIGTAMDGFWLHLGSTGCEGTLRNITGCRAPNRVTVALDNFIPGRDVVVLDLGELVSLPELADGKASDCSSGPGEQHCQSAFAALGLDHGNGSASGEQQLFASRAAR